LKCLNRRVKISCLRVVQAVAGSPRKISSASSAAKSLLMTYGFCASFCLTDNFFHHSNFKFCFVKIVPKTNNETNFTASKAM